MTIKILLGRLKMALDQCNGIGSFYQHHPKLPVMVTSHAKGKANAMASTWNTAMSFSPPLYVISISSKTFTHQLILDSKEFVVNFMPFEKIIPIIHKKSPSPTIPISLAISDSSLCAWRVALTAQGFRKYSGIRK